MLGKLQEKRMDYSQKISERQWNLPDKGELEGILSGYGVKNICLSGPGAYGRTIPREILVKIMASPDQKKAFLDFCYRYDSNPYVCGMGKDNLLAVGDI